MSNSSNNSDSDLDMDMDDVNEGAVIRVQASIQQSVKILEEMTGNVPSEIEEDDFDD